ncbi:MAG: site-specific integrase, partial [Bacteroidales bacterium]|nr:site-specific integrase [Bacteroidales bacterium]
MNATIKIVLKTDFIRKDGTSNIRLRLTINQKVKYYPLHIFVNPKNFKSGKITGDESDSWNKNLLIKKYFIKATTIIYTYQLNDTPITFENFERDFDNKFYGSKSFYHFLEQKLILLQGKLTPGTLKGYNDQVNKLKDFRAELLFKNIDKSFIDRYELFLIKERNNNSNTVNKSMKFLKSMLNRAVDDGLIKENVFDKISIGRTIGNREFLTLDELNRLNAIYFSNMLKPNKANVLRYFLFCCYTGLRYSDVANLHHTNILDGNYLSVEMIKTKEHVKIPLSEKAKELLPLLNFKAHPVFKVLKDQPTNRYLKEIMKDAEINKRISFHCSRHTFATVSKSLGIDYDVISKILGHTDIKTTQIYTKYELEHLTTEM